MNTQDCGLTNESGFECIRSNGHAGSHRTFTGNEWKTETKSQEKKPETVSSMVAVTVDFHRALAAKELAETMARMDSLPSLSSNARTLRAKRDRLKMEIQQWESVLEFLSRENG